MPFDRPKKPEFQPLDQVAPTETQRATTPEEVVEERPISRAENIVETYGKTIAFSDFLVGLIDERLKDISVQIDPEEEPEVWAAMERIFQESVNQTLGYQSYTQVLEALRDVNRVELDEANADRAEEDELIAAIDTSGETEDHPTPEMEYQLEDDQAIEDAAKPRTIDIPSGLAPPPPPPPPPPPRRWIRRYTRFGRVLRWVKGRRLSREDYIEFLRRRHIKFVQDRKDRVF